MLKFVGWPAMKKARLIVSMPPRHGSLVLTRSQMGSPRLQPRCVISLKLCRLRARVGRSATVQRSRPWTQSRRTRLHHCLLKRVKPTIDDLKLASEHDVVGHLDSVTCNRCGQRALHRAAFLKRCLKSPCLAGHRVILPDGTHRVAPVPGQGRLRHQTTHPSHNCTFDPILDTWICLTCGFYGSDVFKLIAQPCTGAANQAGRDNLSRVDRGLMPGSSKAARDFNARRNPV